MEIKTKIEIKIEISIENKTVCQAGKATGKVAVEKSHNKNRGNVLTPWEAHLPHCSKVRLVVMDALLYFH